MLIKDIGHLIPFASKDSCLIKEIIHPKNDGVSAGISLALAEVEPGGATKPHRLNVLEIYYILSGRGTMHIADQTAEVKPGRAVYIPPGQIQFIENSGNAPLKFLCICHPAYDPDLDELLEN